MRVTYAHLPDGGFLAAAPNHPDEYLTWLEPNRGTCSLNVQLHQRANNYEGRPVGRMLDFRAFQIQAETILGADEHVVDALPHELVYNRDLTVGRCSCGHWRASVPMGGAPAVPVKDFAFVSERHELHAALEALIAVV